MKKSPCKSSYSLQSGRKISLGLLQFLDANILQETKKEKERKLLWSTLCHTLYTPKCAQAPCSF